MDAEDANATVNPTADNSKVIPNTKTSILPDKNSGENEIKDTHVGVKPVGQSVSEPGQGAQIG